MSDESYLLRAIRAEPGEDTPRLAYADWLDERDGPGDAARAEFIRLQIRIARLIADEPTPPAESAMPGAFIAGYRNSLHRAGAALAVITGIACDCVLCLQEREQKLLLGNTGGRWRDWLGPAIKLVPTDAKFQAHAPLARGFVGSATCTAEAWLAHGDAVCESHPVTNVKLTTWVEFEELTIGSLDGSTSYYRVAGRQVKIAGVPVDAKPALESRWPGITFEVPTLAEAWEVVMGNLTAGLSAGAQAAVNAANGAAQSGEGPAPGEVE